MDWTGRENRQALKRVVALLFAFAALADRAGAKPRPIRVAVLWLLRAVESIAWEFVIAVAREGGDDPYLAVPPHARDVADDAGRLARSFTALAELLADLARRNPSSLPHGRISGLVAHLMQMLWSAVDTRAPTRPAPDTS